MNTSIDGLPVATFDGARIHVRLPGGFSFSFPVAGNKRLERASREQIVNVEIDGDGLHWPEIDEDLSFAGLLRGDYGQRTR